MSAARSNVLVRRGEAADATFATVVTPEAAGWAYSSLWVLELGPSASATLDTGPDEIVVLPLSGGCDVSCGEETFTLAGRESVFSGVTDFAFAPPDSRVAVSAAAGGRFAIVGARAERRFPARYVAASEVAVELRGAGQASRQVNNFCAPGEFEADRLIAVEVLTPGGNWSSYPPHKHDEDTDVESALEEIYYFEVADGGPAYQRVYTSGEGKEIDVCAEVSTGDVVLIPFGYHGPSMAAPGYDLYYLNVMAGPGKRIWKFCDDPAHAWIRDTWAGQPIDPRLPLTTAGGKA